jgi:predicted RNase H-like HicB family nuclease
MCIFALFFYNKVWPPIEMAAKINIDMKQLTYRVLLNREPEGGYTVTVPALPGCITYGETIDEAIAMAKEAIGLYIESLVAHNEPVPDESNTLEYALTLEAAV